MPYQDKPVSFINQCYSQGTEKYSTSSSLATSFSPLPLHLQFLSCPLHSHSSLGPLTIFHCMFFFQKQTVFFHLDTNPNSQSVPFFHSLHLFTYCTHTPNSQRIQGTLFLGTSKGILTLSRLSKVSIQRERASKKPVPAVGINSGATVRAPLSSSAVQLSSSIRRSSLVLCWSLPCLAGVGELPLSEVNYFSGCPHRGLDLLAHISLCHLYALKICPFISFGYISCRFCIVE